jgi:hypothetical protein
MIATIAVAPAFAAPSAAAALPLLPEDPAMPSCDAWLARDDEIERLQLSWSRRESWLADRFAWFDLSEDERRALPEAQMLYRIDARLDALWIESEFQLRRLPRLAATSLKGVGRKLAIVGRAIEPDDYPHAHRLLSSALKDLQMLEAAQRATGV